MAECSGCLITAALLVVTALLIFAYFFSRLARYYIRCVLWYLTMLLNAAVCVVIGPPARIFGDASKVVFKSMFILSRWTGIQVDLRRYDEVYLKQMTPCVVLCNHQSALDVVVMAASFPPRGTAMMKKSLMYVPIFNITAWLCNSIFVDRFNRERAQKAIDQCTDAIKQKNLKLWVFPEGTRNRSLDGMLPFKKGAFNIAVNAQIPVVPMVASSYKCFYSKHDKYFESDGEVIVHVMDPIPTTGLRMDDVPAFSDKVREQMLEVYERITAEVNERMMKKRGTATPFPPPACLHDKKTE